MVLAVDDDGVVNDAGAAVTKAEAQRAPALSILELEAEEAVIVVIANATRLALARNIESYECKSFVTPERAKESRGEAWG